MGPVPATYRAEQELEDQPPESGKARPSSSAGTAGAIAASESDEVNSSWNTLMRWSRWLRRKGLEGNVLDRVDKVVVFGGGSFGTAIAASLARQKAGMNVTLLLRDPYVCQQINQTHRNIKYLQVCARRYAGFVSAPTCQT
jgi:glycerol-3-phosphate dehydrogenase (NAD+)